MVELDKTVTIRDVAKKAGVSTATVSHVLNKTRYVSEELTSKVNEAIKELDYYPNQLVGGLRRNKSFTIGLILPSISNETFGFMAEKIQGLLFEQGYNLIICNTSYDVEMENQALDTLIMKKADAVIVVPSSSNSEKLKEIKDRGIPIVLVDRLVNDLNVDSVIVDNYRGSYEMVKYLIKLGHREIGYINRKTILSHSIDQLKGYIKALKDSGIEVKEHNIVMADGYSYDSGYRAATQLLAVNPKITAIFGYYDIVAFGAMRAVFDMGYQVPKDISIVGYDAMPFTRSAHPSLTTVSFPVTEMAKLVVEQVIARLEEKDRKDENMDFTTNNIVIAPKLLIGESSKKVC